MVLIVIGIAAIIYALRIAIALSSIKHKNQVQRKENQKALAIFGLGAVLLITGVIFNLSATKKATAKKIDINDTRAIETYLQGKWHWESHTGRSINEVYRYRAEIIGNKLKIWMCISNPNDAFDMNNDGFPKTHEFTLGQPTRDVDGSICRYLDFDEGNVSLAYRAIAPVWIIVEDRLDTPYLTSGTGIPGWTRGW